MTTDPTGRDQIFARRPDRKHPEEAPFTVQGNVDEIASRVVNLEQYTANSLSSLEFTDIAGTLSGSRISGGYIPNESWTNITSYTGYVPNWRDYGGGGSVYTPAGIMKDAHGFMHLRGLVDAQGTESATQYIFQIAAGHRPPLGKRYVYGCASGNGLQRIDVYHDSGNVYAVIFMGTTIGGWISLDGISWLAEA